MLAIDAEMGPKCLACNIPMEPFRAAQEDGYFLCRRCSLVRVSPPPTEEALRNYYAECYQVDRENYMRGIQRNGENLLRLLKRQSSVGRVLEIGSSWGGFLTFAASHGWRVAGVELSPEAACWAREHGAPEVHCGTLASSPFLGGGEFDAVVAWHVIEHLVDPLEFLRQAYSCLRPGGILALRTPNIASFAARVNGRAWEWFGAPAHLALFSPVALARVVERAGFQILETHTLRGDSHNPWLETVRGTLIRSGIGAQLKAWLGWKRVEPDAALHHQMSRGQNRRMQSLARLDRAADVVLFPLYPCEMLINSLHGGAEIFLVARRADAIKETRSEAGLERTE
jgi:2-polyprenyl-3-methyl-5-hydroxy-6-metoxy-1,4-benzoquinol methylase